VRKKIRYVGEGASHTVSARGRESRTLEGIGGFTGNIESQQPERGTKKGNGRVGSCKSFGNSQGKEGHQKTRGARKKVPTPLEKELSQSKDRNTLKKGRMSLGAAVREKTEQEKQAGSVVRSSPQARAAREVLCQFV